MPHKVASWSPVMSWKVQIVSIEDAGKMFVHRRRQRERRMCAYQDGTSVPLASQRAEGGGCSFADSDSATGVEVERLEVRVELARVVEEEFEVRFRADLEVANWESCVTGVL